MICAMMEWKCFLLTYSSCDVAFIAIWVQSIAPIKSGNVSMISPSFTSKCRQMVNCCRNVRTPAQELTWGTQIYTAISVLIHLHFDVRMNVHHFFVRTQRSYMRPLVYWLGCRFLCPQIPQRFQRWVWKQQGPLLASGLRLRQIHLDLRNETVYCEPALTYPVF